MRPLTSSARGAVEDLIKCAILLIGRSMTAQHCKIDSPRRVSVIEISASVLLSDATGKLNHAMLFILSNMLKDEDIRLTAKARIRFSWQVQPMVLEIANHAMRHRSPCIPRWST